MMEWYEAYTDYGYQMVQFETLVAEVAEDILGTTTINYQGTELDLSPPWRRLTVLESIKEYGEIDPSLMFDKEIMDYCSSNDIQLSGEYNSKNRGIHGILFTDRIDDILNDPELDIIVEVMGAVWSLPNF